MVEIVEVPRLNRRAEEAYEKYLAIKQEKKRLEARIEELEIAAKQEEATLSTQFGVDQEYRRLPGNRILKRWVTTVKDKVVTEEMLGTVIRKGYSYPNYKEIEG